MNLEIEVKFLDTVHDEVRAALQQLGATLEQPMRLMRRTLFDYPDHRLQKDHWGRIRVRDEGNRVTLSYKAETDGDYSNELETTIGSYDVAVEFFKTIGLVPFTFQESRRETWHYKDVEVVLDEWPWLRPGIEIEGPSEQAIKACAEALGFDWQQRAYGNVDTAYRAQYPGMKEQESIGAVSDLRFAGSMPAWLQERM